MENIKELMAEYMALASKQDAKSRERRDEIHRYLSANATEEDKKYIIFAGINMKFSNRRNKN